MRPSLSAPNRIRRMFCEGKTWAEAFSSWLPPQRPKADQPGLVAVRLPAIWINPTLRPPAQPVVPSNQGERFKKGSALHNCTGVKQAFCRWHRHKGKDLSTAARLAKNGYPAGISPERCDVVANPFQHRLRGQACQRSRNWRTLLPPRLQVEIAIHVQADDCESIRLHHDAGETLAVIGKKIMPAAAGKSSAVHVDHDRALTRGIDLLCPKIEA